MSKYTPLSERLAGHEGPEWRATFAEVEEVLGFPLPKGARTGRAWWAAADKPHARAWTQHGFQAEADPVASLVTFRRSDISPAAVAAVLEPPGAELQSREAAHVVAASYAQPTASTEVQPPAMQAAAEAASRDMHKTRGVGMAALVAGSVAVVAAVGTMLARGMGRRR